MKNKIITFIILGFSAFFLFFVFYLTNELATSDFKLKKSPNIVDVTNFISTKLLITDENMPIDGEWSQKDFNAVSWEEIRIPEYSLIQNSNYKIGRFAYYRINIPRNVFDKLKHLNNESSIALQEIFFNRLDITINGKYFKTNKPQNAVEAFIILPVNEESENIIGIKGYIGEGDTGIDHRDRILIGRNAELNELIRSSYKKTTVFPLVFILCKGSILFIFALIFILVNVETSFEKFLIFGLCTIVEELIAGDYLYEYLNFNLQVYLFDFVNVVASIALVLFFCDLLSVTINKGYLWLFGGLLVVCSLVIVTDSLYKNYLFSITTFLKFWNVIQISIILFFAQKIFKFNRLLFATLCVSIALNVWSVVFSENVGLNLKAYGSLLLFFVVAYQTFVIFRREQEVHKQKDKQLLEQEKDVAIGRTAKILAHDVRKPLELTRLLLEKISNDPGNTNFLEIAKRDIDHSLASVTSQVNEIMNLERVNDLTLSEVSFHSVLSASIRQVMSVEKNIDINLKYDFSAKKKVLADESRLINVLVNLITNAVEAIRDIGGKQNGVISFKTEDNRNHFVFRILNDGPLIPENALSEIFKPLFTNGKPKGTGLGLASVKKIISDHKGTIEVQNIPSVGVEFKIILLKGTELDSIELNSVMNSSKSYSLEFGKDELESNTKVIRIFLLESEEYSLEHFKYLCSKLPYEVELDTAVDIANAKELITKKRYDLYILDYDLQGNFSVLDFHQEYLAFLDKGLIFQTNAVTSNVKNQLVKKPITYRCLIELCDEYFKNKQKILLVDDTKLIRVAWASFHGKHNIVCADSPEEALKILNENMNDFNVCVLDYYFKNSSINGEELANQIREIRNDMIIFIASSLDQEIKDFKSISKRDYDVRKVLFR